MTKDKLDTFDYIDKVNNHVRILFHYIDVIYKSLDGRLSGGLESINKDDIGIKLAFVNLINEFMVLKLNGKN